MILTTDIKITLTLQWIGDRKSMAAHRAYALTSFQEVVSFCGTQFLVCKLHTPEVSCPWEKKKKCSLLHWKSAGKTKFYLFSYLSLLFFFFPPPENILLSLGARFKLAEVKEKFYPLVSMRRTSDTSVCMLQKHAFRPWLRKALSCTVIHEQVGIAIPFETSTKHINPSPRTPISIKGS